MISFTDFERRYGILTFERLKNPKLYKLSTLSLPRGPIIHYLPKDSVEVGIEPRDPILNAIEDDILVNHVIELKTQEGVPRHQPSGAKKIERDYHRRFRRLRLLRRMDSALRDGRTAIVNNYAMSQHLWLYRRTAMSTYHSWLNLSNTLWSEIETLTKTTDRFHYIEIGLPRVIPTREKFRSAERKINKDVVDTFNSNEALTLLELYLWLGDDTQSGTHLDTIDPKYLKHVNLVLMESGQWCLLSFKRLLEWKQEHSGENAQKAFLSLVDSLMSVRSVNELTPEEALELEEEEELEHIQDVAVRTKTIREQSAALAEAGLLTAKEMKRMEKLAAKYIEIPSPTGTGTIEDLVKPKLEKIKGLKEKRVRDLDIVFDKSMLRTTVNDFDKDYIGEVMESDIAATALSLQDVGFAVTDYKKEVVVDAVNKYHIYTIKLTPVSGQSSTIRFRLPEIHEDGTFLANGVRARFGKQRSDVPIRKTDPGRVALTSYYGKNFVDRSGKKTANYASWLLRKITATGEEQVPSISTVEYGDVFTNKFRAPRTYTAIAKEVTGFKVNGFTLNFDSSKRQELYGEATLKKLETNGNVVCGSGKGGFVTIDETDTFYFAKDDSLEPIGSFSDLVSITEKPPVEFATVTIYGKTIPLALVLSYKLGINKLLKKLKVKHRIVPKGTRLDLGPDEYAVQFKDETLIGSTSDKVAALVLNGFNDYKRFIRSFDLNDFNSKDTIFAVLTRNQLGVRYAREIELMFDMFIDPITLELLKEMKEPTKLDALLLRSAELLTTDEHPDETDLNYMRLRGYERFSGMVYRQLVDSVRKYRQMPPGRASLELNPRAVWMDIVKDQSVTLIEDSNPVHNLKEKELVTYSGQGGRSAQSMVKRTRVFHESDIGTISEATVDSGKVAINTYTSANPNLTSLRGTTKRFDLKEDGAASMMSTSALLFPATDKDEAKRIGFVSIQASSGMAAKGYRTPPLRTGYEAVVAHRADDLFAFPAEEDGKVLEVTDKVIKVEYKSGEVKGIELGTRYGKVTGTTVAHNVITDVKPGKKFKAGDVLAYNDGFFERDFFDSTQATYKHGTMATVALIETTDTLEDSCAITEGLSKQMVSPKTKAKVIHVNFDQELHNVVSAGEQVNSDSILCTIEDSVTSGTDLFDTDTIETLSLLAANTPRADLEGTVSKIEVLYHGDKKDMSPSLKALTERSDRERSKLARGLENGAATTGQVHDVIRVEGNKLELDQAIITIYIDGQETMGVGGKGVFGNALKTVVGRVMTGTNETEDGIKLDGLFSYHAIAARVVLSPEEMGTTNMLLKVLSKQAAEVYRGKR